MAVNKVVLVGYLGKTPELKKVSSGAMKASFTVATNDFITNKKGEQQTLTEWHNIIAWGKLAEICGQYLHKGSQVYLSGKIQYRSYEDRNGNKRFITEVVIDDMQMPNQTKEQTASSTETVSGRLATDADFEYRPPQGSTYDDEPF